MAEVKANESMLKAAGALYKLPQIIEIAESRHYTTQYPQKPSYGQGETIVFDMATGSSYIDPLTSYLSFQMSSAVTADWGSGSAANIMERVIVRSKDGTILSQLEGANLFIQFYQRYNCSEEAFNTILVSQGYQANITTAIFSSNPATGAFGTFTGGIRYIIPLHIISPFFNQHKLLPSHICEGLRIEIQLASVGQALYTTVFDPTATYTINRLELQLDSYMLGNSYDKKLTEMASKQGLILHHDEYYRQLVSGVSDNFEFDMRKAASFAKQILCIPRNNSQISTAVASATQQCFISAPYDWERIQFHIGSTYYPTKPLEITYSGSVANAYDHYYYTLAAFRKLKCQDAGSVRPDSDFIAQNATTDPTDKKDATGENGVNLNCAAAWVGKSYNSDNTGSMVNNSRALAADLRFRTPLDGRIDAYLKHLRLVKVGVKNVIVRD
jgi:hypothetical protein